MSLTKWVCDPYSTTEDTRNLNEIGYDIMVKFNGRWVVRNDLKPMQPGEIYESMTKVMFRYVRKLGYLTQEQYDAYFRERNARIRKFLASKTLPPEYAHKYAVVWVKDGKLGYTLDDDEECASLILESIKKINPEEAYIISPAK